MLTQICQEIRNWFDRNLPKWHGDFTISNGEIADVDLKTGQYFRVIGSIFNDGVHQYPDSGMTDETFSGSIWAMAVPPEVIALSSKIQEWQNTYGTVNSSAMSPYSSESFGGYSYSKSGGSGTSSGDTRKAGTWRGVFKNDLDMWRKI